MPDNTFTHLKAIVELLAYAGAAAFFLYKAVTGYLIVNVALSVKVERVKFTDSEDYLSIATTIKKGPNGSLVLHDCRARVNDGTDVTFQSIRRLSYASDPESNVKQIIFDKRSESYPLLRLTPLEEATFSAFLKVPHGKPCVVEVAVLGILTGGTRVGQWRTSMVSLPLSEENAKKS